MPPELREGLRRLCRSHGWDYGVFWRFDRRDPRLLVMESFYEEQTVAAVGKAITHVHLVGEGAIGGAALSGKHQWIYSDTCWDGSSPTSPIRNVETFLGIDERQHQLLAGIKTIVIIPLPSFGVVQFGSAQKNVESLEFIHQVQRLFHQLDTMSRHFLSGDSCSAVNICDPSAVLASRPASFKSIDSLHDLVNEELLEDVQSTATAATLWPNLFPLESHSEARSLSGSINPHSSTMPEAVTTEGTSGSFGDPFQNVPTIRSFSLSHITSQYGASGADPHVLLFPDNNKFSYSSSNSSTANLNANNWAMEVDTLPMLDRRNFPEMASHPHSSVPHMNPLHLSSGDSVTACNPCRSQDLIYGSGEVLGLHHSSLSSPFQLDGLSTFKSSSKLPSFASDLVDNFFTVPPDLAVLSKFKDDHHPHPCETPPELVIKGLSEPTEDNLMNVQSEPISCSSPSSNLLAMPAVNSPHTDGDQKECSATVSTQPRFDNDLFEGMELDINPKESRKECWDELIMPLGNGISSNLGTSVSDGIPDMDMCSIAVADKGLFSESSFEQLLDVVVGGSANLSSSTSSMPTTNNSSVSSLDLEHRLSALARVDYPQVCRDRASLPEPNLEKIMQGSLKGSYSFAEKKAFSNSHVGSWIDDSCSMNTESAVTNQAKKPEETAKVARKRARPGESTRPRPKDRQQIQDRVKELREIVPNGSKCSIDSLLDRTIKHMLFLQSVTKYADKLKHTDEPKMIGNASGVVLKDNSGTGSSGATWAYEVAGRTMVCPILVEDLNPPGLMLVEMLCEDRGLFLEIADIIRGFSLTILKGVMETRESKIWARFLVEANKGVTRMDIFLSLVQLSQQTSSMRSHEQENKAIDKGGSTPFSNHQPSPISIPVGFTDGLQ